MPFYPTITRFADFRHLKKNARRAIAPAYIALYATTLKPPAPPQSPYPPRYAIIASNKVGNAIQRNRCKRRLRALIQHTLKTPPTPPLPNNSIIMLVARKATLKHPFAAMCQDFQQDLPKLPTQPINPPPPPRQSRQT